MGSTKHTLTSRPAGFLDTPRSAVRGVVYAVVASVFATGVASGDDPGAPLLARLAATDPETRKGGYELMEGPARHQLPAALTEIARLLASDQARTSALVAELAPAIPALRAPAAFKAFSTAVERWDAARAKARAAMYDEEKYPAPGPTVVMRGPYTGAAGVKSVLAAVEKAYAPIDACGKAATTELGDAKVQVARLEEIRAIAGRSVERVAVLERHGRKGGAARDVPLDLAARMSDLAADNPELALAAHDQLLAPDRAVLFAAYGRALAAKALKKADDSGTQAREGLERIDAMRLAFGLLPFEYSVELATAVGSHVTDMRDRGYFSHYSPDAARQTPSLRAKAAGWNGLTGECLATAGPIDSIAIWLWDGGHARIVFSPSHHWIGIGWAANTPAQQQRWRSVGYCGINTGVGPPPAWPRPDLYPLEPAKPQEPPPAR